MFGTQKSFFGASLALYGTILPKIVQSSSETQSHSKSTTQPVAVLFSSQEILTIDTWSNRAALFSSSSGQEDIFRDQILKNTVMSLRGEGGREGGGGGIIISR